MGFLKKLRKRDDRFVRIARNKAAKRDARAAHNMMLEGEAARRYAWELEGKSLHDTQVIFIKALHDTFGFGTKRLIDVVHHVSELGDTVKKFSRSGVSVQALRDQLEAETGYDIDIHEIKGGPEIQIQKIAVDEISVLYLWTLHAKYGFGKGRLQKMYAACAGIGDDLKHGRLTMDGLMEELFGETELTFRMRRRKTA